MARVRALALVLGGLWLLGGTPPARCGEAGKTPRELIQYIEDAKRLGLKEDEIRQNAVVAGWSKELVGEALVIVRYLSSAGPARPSAATPSAAAPRAVEPANYRIGPGDVLQILVWKEPDASVPSVVVRPDGKITVPLAKEVEAAGFTPRELEKNLAGMLARYIRDVDVTVIPKDIVSQKVYMLGAVRKEGPVPLTSAMTVLQALNVAGGVTEYAKKKKIYILRKENGQQVRLPFDYEAVIRGERAEQNITLRPEDTVVVP